MSLLSAPDGGSFVDGDTFSEMFDRAVDQITAAVSRHLLSRAGQVDTIMSDETITNEAEGRS
jgi:hypothetical protein